MQHPCGNAGGRWGRGHTHPAPSVNPTPEPSPMARKLTFQHFAKWTSRTTGRPESHSRMNRSTHAGSLPR